MIVTGAARGIGEAISHVLARDGATGIGVDMPAAGEALTEVMNAVGGIAGQLDITADDAGDQLLAKAGERFGRLDGIVHNAGITRYKLLANMDTGRDRKHTSELQSRFDLVCRLLLEKKKHKNRNYI